MLEGVCIVLMAVSGIRERIMNAIPRRVKTAITVGIGLYIALVGLVSAGFVTRTPDSANSTVPVRMGQGGHLTGWPMVVFCVGLLLMIVLIARKVPGRGADQHRAPPRSLAVVLQRRCGPARTGAWSPRRCPPT